MTLLFRKVKKVKIDGLRSSWRWIPGIVAALTTVMATEAGLFQSFQALTYNILFRLRGPIPWNEQVVVIEIDDASIQALGQFPIARRYYAQLLDQLNAAQPGVVAFDIVFADGSSDDAALAEAMNQLNRVVLAQSWDNLGQPIEPTPALAEHAINFGHVLNPPTDDGISRSIRPYIQEVPALGIAIAQSYSLVAEAIATPDNQYSPSQKFWINWPGPSETCISYSFRDVLEGKIPAAAFQGKIVLVGMTASGNSPIFTPFDRTPPTGGVYLQAAVVNNLLQGNNLHPTGSSLQVLLLVLGGPVLGSVSNSRGRRYRWASWFGFCIGWNLLSLIFLKLNVLVPLFWPLVLVTLTIGFTEAVERLRAIDYLQREIERLWHTYHSDLIFWRRSPNPALPPPPNSGPNAVPRSMIEPANLNRQPVAVQRAMQLAQLAELFGRSQSLHAAIARNLSVGLVAADWDGRVWLCNSFAETLTQMQIGDLLASKLIPTWISLENWRTNLQHLGESKSPRWEVHYQNRWFELQIEPLFYTYQTPDNRTQALPTAVSLLAPSQPTGLLLLIKDITTFKGVEAEVRNALAEALELNDLKTRFISMVSHELRTPLTIMRTSVDLLKLHGLEISPEKYAKYLNHMEAAVLNMQNLVEDVLTLGKSDTRNLSLNPQPLNVEAFCQQIVDQLQLDNTLNHTSTERIHLRLALDPAQPIKLDSTLLSLILNNVLSNALKYSPAEMPIDFNVTSTADGITFEVCDRGIGMSMEDQARIFEEFSRATNVGNIPGLGLGLSIVKRCVGLHGGSIRLESQVGVGTTIQIFFPCAGMS